MSNLNSIKGLIIKDLLQLKAYKKNFLISIVIYCLLILSNSDDPGMASIGAIMIMFLFSTYAMATFNYDEKSKSDRYLLTLPLTKKEVMLSKYLLGILSLVLGALVGSIIGVIFLLYEFAGDFSCLSFFSTLLGGAVALSFMQSIQIPYICKYGAEKGRLQIYIVMMVIMALFGFSYALFPNLNLDFLDRIDYLLPVIGILLIIINYYISFNISMKIYSKKEI